MTQPIAHAQESTPCRTRHAGRAAVWWRLACWAALLFPALGLAAGPHHVLVLFAHGRLLPANVEGDRGMTAEFATRPDLHLDVSSEFLEYPRFEGPAYEATLRDFIKRKYQANPPDVIIAIGDEALDFMLRNRKQLFPEVPIVHAVVSSRFLDALPPLPADVLGTPLRYELADTVEQARRWQPGLERLVLVTGASAWDRRWEAQLRAQAAAMPGSLQVDVLAALPEAELAARLAALPSNTMVFTPGYFLTGDGFALSPRDAARRVAQASSVPVYGPFPTFLGTGVVGGHMASYVTMGRMGARLALALLSGQAPGAIEVPARVPAPLQLDWRQVRRWGFAPAAIPAEAVVHFRPPNVWQAHPGQVLLAAAALLLQGGLILALLVERKRRRRTSRTLQRSEQHMRLAADAANLSLWALDPPAATEGTAPSAAAGRQGGEDRLPDFRRTLDDIHPQDRERVAQALNAALETGQAFDLEYRLVVPDGEPRWQSARGRAEAGPNTRLVGVAIDITRRREAELRSAEEHAALQHMTRVALLGQLTASITHQLNQPLAAILGNAEAARLMLAREPLDVAELSEICADIIAQDHRAAQVIQRLGALFKRSEPRFEPVNLNLLAEETLELARGLLEARQVRLALPLSPTPPLVHGDRVQLQQLLLNLVVNAMEAMEAVPEAQRVITVGTELQGDQASLFVADRGPGVSPLAGRSVFEPFWSTKDSGMGIGLALCRTIAQAHGGSLELSAASGGGALFRAQFPAESPR